MSDRPPSRAGTRLKTPDPSESASLAKAVETAERCVQKSSKVVEMCKRSSKALDEMMDHFRRNPIVVKG